LGKQWKEYIMTIALSVESVAEALREAVEEKGADYVYTNEAGEVANLENAVEIQCQYVHTDKPGCIVGNVLHRLGVPLYVLSDYETRPARSVVESLSGRGILEFERKALDMLRYAQSYQDNGNSWGDAEVRALSVLA